jgi:hypothetical protein
VDFGIGFEFLQEAAAAHCAVDGNGETGAKFVSVAQALPDAGELLFELVDRLIDGCGIEFNSIDSTRKRSHLMRDVKDGHVDFNGGAES